VFTFYTVQHLIDIILVKLKMLLIGYQGTIPDMNQLQSHLLHGY
jgi:hypothetical protein